MKKRLLLIIMMFALVLCLCACNEKKEEVKPNESEQEAYTPSEEETIEEEEYVIPTATEADFAKCRVKYNGIEFGVGDKFEDVKAGLGAEIRPAQTYKPCAAMVEGEVTTHAYEGVVLETTQEGTIYTIKFSVFDQPNSTAELSSGIKFGSTHDEVINALGKSESDDEYNITYSYDNLYIGIGLDAEATGTVNYISIEASV